MNVADVANLPIDRFAPEADGSPNLLSGVPILIINCLATFC
jgi:hypothetical protein